MKTFKQTVLGRLIPSILFLLVLSGCALHQPALNETVIDSVTVVTIYTPCGVFKEIAKIDTGADGLSVDETLARSICLQSYIGDTTNKHCPNGQAWVTNAMGGECRERVHFNFSIDGVYVEDRATVTDKSEQRYDVLIGNRALAGRFLVRPVPETNTKAIILEAEEEEEN